MGTEQLKYDQKGLSMLPLGLKWDGFPETDIIMCRHVFVQT